jgi:hypothetical protein
MLWVSFLCSTFHVAKTQLNGYRTRGASLSKLELGKACNLGASKNLHFALSCSLLSLLVDSAEFIYRVQGVQMLECLSLQTF